MTLLVLVLAWLVRQRHEHLPEWSLERHWLERCRGWLVARLDDGVLPELLVLAVCLVPVLPVLLLQWLLQGVWYNGPLFLFDTACMVLLMAAHARRERSQDGYGQHMAQGEWQSAFEHALQDEQLGTETGRLPDSVPDMQREVIAQRFSRGLQHAFSPLFWFVLTGPWLVLFYFLLQALRERAHGERDESEHWQRIDMVCSAWLFLLEWVPVRIMAVLCALMGDFEAVIKPLRQHIWSFQASTRDVIADCAQAALGRFMPEVAASTAIPGERDSVASDVVASDVVESDSEAGLMPLMPVDELAMRTQAEMQLSRQQSLMERILVAWVVLIALIVLFG